ncbi:5'/3'-nucleotidase SurE [Entomohabitans teleogrylli]|uniref:5'/3'-nucleotidase SurE n=1 Tax=Entomohabitans teleogrylli TaxID=1384589 RepID=UPI00073D5C04|nr:5'/3'-nucleotidase SurE [Entomohabitans teleogrylli]
MNEAFVCQRILLTNDDGINAPGMAVLEKVAARLAPEVWVVAPLHDQSGTSHSLSLHHPLRLTQTGERRFAVSGTPGDCVALACGHLMKGTPPDLLLSGINRGANLGVETMFSGTVGAAMTGLLSGIPSIALSQAYIKRSQVPWETAAAAAPQVIRTLVETGWRHNVCLNVNFPAVAPDQLQPLTVTRQGHGYLENVQVTPRTDPRANDYFWLSLQHTDRPDSPHTEAMALSRGQIAVTPLQFDRTHEEYFSELQQKITAAE